MEQQQQLAQFSLNAPGGSLVLRGGKKQVVNMGDRSNPLAGSCSFTTRAATGVTKRMLVVRPARGAGARALPMASLSLSVALPPFASLSGMMPPFAAATVVVKGKGKGEEPKKKKRSPKDVWDAACK